MKHLLAICALALAATTGTAIACLHPGNPSVQLVETGQKALIMYADGREELIIKVDYAGYAAPGPLAWVVPTPSVPDHYAETDPALFDELHRLTQPPQPRSKGLRSKSKSAAPAMLIMHQPVNVGTYTIQPIGASGPEAGPALNTWLKSNGFGEVPEANMKWYLDKGWTFLAIKTEANEPKGGLKPLRISFAADRLWYPLKFSSHQGDFPVTVYTLTKERLKPEAIAGLPGGFKAVGQARIVGGVGTSALKLLMAEIAKEGRLMIGRGHLRRLQSRRVNTQADPVAKWPEDFSIAAP
ncbi:MAG: DUF2330 domain-containing protein [Bradymonadia bacterium]